VQFRAQTKWNNCSLLFSSARIHRTFQIHFWYICKEYTDKFW